MEKMGPAQGRERRNEAEVGVGWGTNVANPNVEQAEPIFFLKL